MKNLSDNLYGCTHKSFDRAQYSLRSFVWINKL